MILQCESRRCVLRFTAYLRELSIDRNILYDRIGAVKRCGKRFIGIPAEEYRVILLCFGCRNRTAGHNGNRGDGGSTVGVKRNGNGITKRNTRIALYMLDQIQQVIHIHCAVYIYVSGS